VALVKFVFNVFENEIIMPTLSKVHGARWFDGENNVVGTSCGEIVYTELNDVLT